MKTVAVHVLEGGAATRTRAAKLARAAAQAAHRRLPVDLHPQGASTCRFRVRPRKGAACRSPRAEVLPIPVLEVGP